MHLEDTIVAIATPPGRGGIGIVRLSGPRARAIAEPLLRLRHPLAAGQARFAYVLDPGEPCGSDVGGAVLDEAVVTFFAAPASYTAEDVVEIAAHGSPVLLEVLLRACVASGARPAEPGEFTRRAFLAGRLDLTAAEAVNDLIHASTLHQARTAAAQLGGALAHAVAPIKQQLVALIAELEAGVDFAEDDLDLLADAAILARLESITGMIQSLADSFAYGRLLRDGFTLAIVGRPNAGKSSLFNRLLETERAIVTADPGTTRDAISERVSIAGIPVELIDTAGLRDAETEAEAQGIARSRTHMAEADVVLHVIDASQTPHPEDQATRAALTSRTHVLVANKVDLLDTHRDLLETGLGLPVSAFTGAGIAALRQAIVAALGAAGSQSSALVTNLRQHNELTSALTALAAARVAVGQFLPHELLLLDLHAALEALDALTGQTTTDDILGLIFSTFCIGK